MRHAISKCGTLMVIIHALTACATHPPTSMPSSSPTSAISSMMIIGHSFEGRPIEAITLGRGRRTILYIATIHGNEPAGTPLLRRFEKELCADPSLLNDVRVVLVPVANPDGLAHKRRTNARGVDLNRNFSTANFTNQRRHGPQPFSEPESRAIAELIETYQPTAIISIHQPLACIDFDGPAETLARAMSEAGNLRIRKLGAQPGSLGSYAGVDRGIATITLELPGTSSDASDSALWSRYGTLLLAPLE